MNEFLRRVSAAAATYPASLHKGQLGIAVLAVGLTRPEIASMPFFGSMR
jgi:hypothetical protein